MSTSYLLDSSVLVLSLKQDKTTQQHLSRAAALYVSTVALGELYYGAEHSVHVKRSLAEVDKLSQSVTVLNADSATARIYGHLKHEQRFKGLMLPDNDLWIAAQQFNIASLLQHVIITLPGLLDSCLISGNWNRRYVLCLFLHQQEAGLVLHSLYSLP